MYTTQSKTAIHGDRKYDVGCTYIAFFYTKPFCRRLVDYVNTLIDNAIRCMQCRLKYHLIVYNNLNILSLNSVLE
jgi:hypothetical protein